MNDRTEVQDMVHQVNMDDLQYRLSKLAYNKRMEVLIEEHGGGDESLYKEAAIRQRAREILAEG